MNEQQVPMIMRVIKLILALVGQEFKQEQDLAAESVAVLHEGQYFLKLFLLYYNMLERFVLFS